MAAKTDIMNLKRELNHPSIERRKSALKTVITDMSGGLDMSLLLPEVVGCTQSVSLDMKKMAYLYVINYASRYPKIAILAVNSLRMDIEDRSPLVRALALRTMGCISVAQIAEYLIDPIKICCRDKDAYVRKSACMAIAKLFRIVPGRVIEEGFLELLQEMILDASPAVVGNVVAAAMEIKAWALRMEIPLRVDDQSTEIELLVFNEKTLSTLLNALNEGNEWSQCVLMTAITDMCSTVLQSTKAYTIITRVSTCLSHGNKGVVMAAIRLIVSLLPKLSTARDLISTTSKISSALISLLNDTVDYETQYVALRVIQITLSRYPLVINGFELLYVRYSDPIFIKREKIETMVKLASEETFDSILPELNEYTSEADTVTARAAVRGMGSMACHVPSHSDKCIEELLRIIEIGDSSLCCEALVAADRVIAQYPNRYDAIIPALFGKPNSITEIEARSVAINLIGCHPQRIEDASHLLIIFAGSLSHNSSFLNRSIIRSALRLYVMDPSELNTVVMKELVNFAASSYGTPRVVGHLPTSSHKPLLSSIDPDSKDATEFYCGVFKTILDSIGDPKKFARYRCIAETVLTQESYGVSREEHVDPFDLDVLMNETGRCSHVQYRRLIEQPPGTVIKDVSSDDCIELNEGSVLNGQEHFKGIHPVIDRGMNDTNKHAPLAIERGFEAIDSDGSVASNLDSKNMDPGDSIDDQSDIDDECAHLVIRDRSLNFPLLIGSNTTGMQGMNGIHITGKLYPSAKFTQSDRVVFLCLRVSNKSKLPALESFKVQINKNPLGLAVDSGVSNLMVKSAPKHLVVPISSTNVIGSEFRKKDGGHLHLQIAVKCNLDIFFFPMPIPIGILFRPYKHVDPSVDVPTHVSRLRSNRGSHIRSLLSSLSEYHWTTIKTSVSGESFSGKYSVKVLSRYIVLSAICIGIDDSVIIETSSIPADTGILSNENIPRYVEAWFVELLDLVYLPKETETE